MSSFNNKYQRNTGREFSKISMAILALLPMLGWYAIPFPVGLGYALVLFLGTYSIIKNKFNINVLPLSFWLIFAYVSFMWSKNNNFEYWTVTPPGGWSFFIFCIALIWGVKNFDFFIFKKFMKYVVLVSCVLFWIQFILMLIYGSNVICLVPNLTGSFTYEQMNYSEMVARQLGTSRPCSIFLEPSYMAYYYITYLAIIWFSTELKNKWINTDIVIIILTLIALRSGTGMIGLVILTLIKTVTVMLNISTGKRLVLIFIIAPLVSIVAYLYADSTVGKSMIARADEFSTTQTSGFDRVVGGYLMFAFLDDNEKICGVANPTEIFGKEEDDGSIRFYANGIQTILLSLGYVGLFLYLFFYTRLFSSVQLSSKMCIIVLLIMALLESNYLSPYMMLLTIVPCAEFHHRKIISHKLPIHTNPFN